MAPDRGISWRSHVLTVAMLGSNYGSQDIEAYVLYYILAEQIGCAFAQSYAMLMTIVTASQLVTRPMTGRLLDLYPQHLRPLLISALLVQLFSELLVVSSSWWAPLVFSSNYAFVVALTAIQTVRNVAFVLTYNALWKVLKLRVVAKFSIVIGAQCRVIGGVFLASEIWEIGVLVLSFFAVYAAQMWLGWSFVQVKYLYSGLMLAFSSVGLVSSLFLHEDYFANRDETPASERSPLLFPGTSAASRTLENVQEAEVGSSSSVSLGDSPSDALFGAATDSFRIRNNDASIVEATKADDSLPDPRGDDAPASLWRAVKDITGPKIARGAFVHLFLLATCSAVASNALSMIVPARGNGEKMVHGASPHEPLYCKGFFVDSSLQAVFINMFYLGGAGFYLAVLKRTNPLNFFQYLFPLASVIGVSALLALEPAFDIPQIAANLLLASVAGTVWYFILYDQFLAMASVRPRSTGMLAAVVGGTLAIVRLVASLLYAVKVPDVAFVTSAVVVMALALIASVLFAVTPLGRGALRRAGVGYC